MWGFSTFLTILLLFGLCCSETHDFNHNTDASVGPCGTTLEEKLDCQFPPSENTQYLAKTKKYSSNNNGDLPENFENLDKNLNNFGKNSKNRHFSDYASKNRNFDHISKKYRHRTRRSKRLHNRRRHKRGRIARDSANEHQPDFEHDQYQNTIRENVPINTTVLTIYAKDNDINENGIIEYSLTGTNDFRVDRGGVVYTKKHLNYQSTADGVYQFTAVAKNPHSKHHSESRVPVRITIIDEPNAPIFDSRKYSFNISEFANSGDYVGTVVARDSDNDLSGYTLGGVFPRDIFIINHQNGIITVEHKSDIFEQTKYSFLAKASDKSGQETSVSVDVHIIDENTNKPIFENCSGYNNLKVTENGTVPKNILMIKAVDADRGPNGHVQYELLTEDASFAIDAVSGQLTVQKPLDRDNGVKEHFLTVVAKDLANGPRSLQNSCSFSIVVVDINDNPPIFDQQKYTQAVPADTNLNVPILRLTASDSDAGRNAEIAYSLEGDGEALLYFKVDSSTGQVALKKPLSQDMINREFVLQARASDRGEVGEHPLTSTVGVTFTVVTPGTMPPTISKQIPENAIVSEDATRDTNIVSLCAKANSDSGQVYMDMINGNLPETNSEGTFDVRMDDASVTDCPTGTSGGNVYLATDNLDFELIQSYTLIIQLTNDKGRSKHSLTVAVKDVNDNPPVLQQPLAGSISENVQSTIVLVVQALDKDVSPEFRQLSYEIFEPSDDVRENFEIRGNGELWNRRPLDREKVKSYRILVKVSDGLNEQVRSYWINVNDRNDEPPRFNLTSGKYSVSINEDVTVEKDTGINLVVDDPDILNEFSYQIISGNDDSKFMIDAISGTVRVNKPLDYDSPVEDRNFTMNVRVSDGKSYDTTRIQINVNNINDLAPVFSPENYSATVTENVDCDMSIVTVRAYDPDDRDNQEQMRYYLNKAEQVNFTIDVHNGNIMVKGCLDRESPEISSLSLRTIYPIAYDDNGNGKNSEPVPVEITILDVNDNHPYIQSPPHQKALFMENIAPEDLDTVVVIRLDDVDDKTKDHGCPCTLEFDVSTSEDILENFAVLPMPEDNQFQLVNKRMLDREEKKFYTIPFLTTDNKGLSGVRHLLVEVGDQNDSPMTDGESRITVYNYRNSFTNVLIGSVYVTDADDHDVADKTFQLISVAEEASSKEDVFENIADLDYFEVGLNNGNITMIKGPPEGNYVIIVDVTDNVRSEKATGTINVRVKALPKEAVMQSGSFVIEDLTAQDVVGHFTSGSHSGKIVYNELKSAFSGLFDVEADNVDIFYLSNVHVAGVDGVHVRFNVHGSPYYTANHLNGLLRQNKGKIEKDLSIKIAVIDNNRCLYEFLDCNGTSCQQELRVDNTEPIVVRNEAITMVGVNITEKYTCNCGYLDPKPRACPEDYCYNGGTCKYSSTKGLTCTCPDKTNYGPRCELLTARLKEGFAWYDALGTCTEPTLHITFQSEYSSAVILYNGPIELPETPNFPSDFLYIILNDWVLEVYLNLGGGSSWASLPILGDIGTDFDLYMNWTTDTLSLKVPNCGMNFTSENAGACERTVSTPKSATSILNAGGPLQIGGLSPMQSLNKLSTVYNWNLNLPSLDPLDGCISYLEYNGYLYDMSRTSYNKNFHETCSPVEDPAKVIMSGASILIIVGSLLLLLLLVLLVLILLRRRRKPMAYPQHLNDIVKETISKTDLEGFGEKDITNFDLKLLRVTTDGKLINGHGTKKANGAVPVRSTEKDTAKKAPLARFSEGYNVEGFIDDSIKKVEKDEPDFDDVRHYCYEGDQLSIASLSSLSSGSEEGDTNYSFINNFGPRFKKLSEIYGPEANEESDSDYELPVSKLRQGEGNVSMSPKSRKSAGFGGQNSPKNARFGGQNSPKSAGQNRPSNFYDSIIPSSTLGFSYTKPPLVDKPKPPQPPTKYSTLQSSSKPSKSAPYGAKEGSSVPYQRLGQNQKSNTIERDKPGNKTYHEAVNPLGTLDDLAASKESWC